MKQIPLTQKVWKKWHGTLSAYFIGYILSAALTGASFLIVWFKALAHESLGSSLLILAAAQAIVQLLFFLHLGKEKKPRWRAMVFGLMLTLLLIFVLGTFWIMYSLDERVMVGM
jgi:cytochrome o ubiquinol oxidase operon protein cyoD